MIIRTFTIACLSILFSVAVLAQDNTQPDQRLLSKFSETELKAMDAETLSYWNSVVANGYRIAKNFKTDSDMEEIELDDWGSADFNMFSHGLEPMETHVQTFRIKGTDKYIQILSEQKIKALNK